MGRNKINEKLNELTLSLFKQKDDMVNSFLRDMIELLILLKYKISLEDLRLDIHPKSSLETEYFFYHKDELIGKRIFKVRIS